MARAKFDENWASGSKCRKFTDGQTDRETDAGQKVIEMLT